MKVTDLICAYAFNKTANFVVSMDDHGLSGTTIFRWDAEEHRHPDDGSYANILHYIPDDIAKTEVSYFTYLPAKTVIDDAIIETGKVETIYIMIPVYGKLYRYLDDDNYPFI